VTLMKARFRSAYEALHGREPEKTWTTPVNTYDPAPHGTLDYIFVSPEFRIADAGLAFDKPSRTTRTTTLRPPRLVRGAGAVAVSSCGLRRGGGSPSAVVA